MASSLLSTKIRIPPLRANSLARPRLTDWLLLGLHQSGSFVLLSSPAGFGKTTLLGQCIVQLPQPAAWLSLDEGDNDPARFWAYLITACQKVLAGVGESALALFQTPQALPVEAVPGILINDLSRSEGELVLVLDDYHVIQNENIHTSLLFLLEHLPGNLHMVVSTRSDPPWPLARFRARNQMMEIRAQDMRFNLEEAKAFLDQTMELDVKMEEAASLAERTEGWAAGLQLAGLSLRGRSDIPRFVKAFSGSHAYIAEYLLEEVLRRQPERVQAFLLKTSLLQRLSGPLCAALTGAQDGQAVLERLYRENLFIVPLDDEGQWYRYHHLFSDLLQLRLRQDCQDEEIAEMHRRAAAWLEQNEFAVEAIHHSLAAKDFEQAARLVEQNTFPLMTRGELATLLNWIEALPDETNLQHPAFLLAKAWALAFSGASGPIETVLQQVERQAEISPETPEGREILGNVAALRAFFSLMAGDDEGAVRLAERAEGLLPTPGQESTRSSPYTLAAHSVLPYTLGMALRNRGEYEKAAQSFAREARLFSGPTTTLIWTIATIELAITRRMQGRLSETEAICRQAMQGLADRGAPLLGSLARLDMVLSDVLREQNSLEEARRLVSAALERAQAWTMPTDRLTIYLTWMRVQEALSDLAGANETLRQAKELKTTQQVFRDVARMVDLYEIRLAILSKDLAKATRLMDEYRPGTSRSVFLRDQELILLAQLRLIQGRAEAALAITSPLALEAKAAGRMYAWLGALAVQACALLDTVRRIGELPVSENGGEAVDCLIQALKFAQGEGFVRVFIDQGQKMQWLLAKCRSEVMKAGDKGLLEYIDRLVEAFDRETSLSAPPMIAPRPNFVPTEPQVEPLIEPLTRREMEVLRLLSAGDSNQDIADRLVITVRAVKKHTGNIFNKLGVHSRTQAIARARRLGLLPA